MCGRALSAKRDEIGKSCEHETMCNGKGRQLLPKDKSMNAAKIDANRLLTLVVCSLHVSSS